MRAKHIFQGIAVCVFGAFVWVFCYLLWIYEGRDKLLTVFICAIFGLLMSSIYLVPLGAAMGVALPPIARQKPLAACLLAGFASGVGIAGVSSLLVTIAFDLRLGTAFVTMCPVCALLVMGWMILLRRDRTVESRQELQPLLEDDQTARAESSG